MGSAGSVSLDKMLKTYVLRADIMKPLVSIRPVSLAEESKALAKTIDLCQNPLTKEWMGSERGVIFWVLVFSMIIDPLLITGVQIITCQRGVASRNSSKQSLWTWFVHQITRIHEPGGCMKTILEAHIANSPSLSEDAVFGVFLWGLLPQWTNTLYKCIRLACSFPSCPSYLHHSPASQFSFYRSPKLLWPNALSRSGRRLGGQAFDGVWWTEMVGIGIWKVFNLPAVFFSAKKFTCILSILTDS